MNQRTEAVRLRVSLEHMTYMIDGFRDLQQTVLPKNPELFEALAEGPLEMISRMLGEIESYRAHFGFDDLRQHVEQMQKSALELDRLRATVSSNTPASYGQCFEAPLETLDRNRREMLAEIKERTQEAVAI